MLTITSSHCGSNSLILSTSRRRTSAKLNGKDVGSTSETWQMFSPHEYSPELMIFSVWSMVTSAASISLPLHSNSQTNVVKSCSWNHQRSGIPVKETDIVSFLFQVILFARCRPYGKTTVVESPALMISESDVKIWDSKGETISSRPVGNINFSRASTPEMSYAIELLSPG